MSLFNFYKNVWIREKLAQSPVDQESFLPLDLRESLNDLLIKVAQFFRKDNTVIVLEKVSPDDFKINIYENEKFKQMIIIKAFQPFLEKRIVFTISACWFETEQDFVELVNFIETDLDFDYTKVSFHFSIL